MPAKFKFELRSNLVPVARGSYYCTVGSELGSMKRAREPLGRVGGQRHLTPENSAAETMAASSKRGRQPADAFTRCDAVSLHMYTYEYCTHKTWGIRRDGG